MYHTSKGVVCDGIFTSYAGKFKTLSITKGNGSVDAAFPAKQATHIVRCNKCNLPAELSA